MAALAGNIIGWISSGISLAGQEYDLYNKMTDSDNEDYGERVSYREE